jgi:hypothetical protein
MSTTQALPAGLDRVRWGSLIAGVIGLALCGLGAMVSPVQFYRSYLVAYAFWIGIALGSAAIVMLHHLVGGLWGYAIRRPLESAAMTLPLMALLFVPIALGVRELYPWAHSGAEHHPLIRHKLAYLNVPFFLGRTVGYFVAWTLIAWLLRRWSVAQDRSDDPRLGRRLHSLSAAGIIVFFLTVTFAMIDWLMSLEPEWYSTIYGPMLMTGQVLTAFALTTIVATHASRSGPRTDLYTPPQWHDLGNLMLAFVMLWTYMSFSQYLIIWSGNLVEEIPWYLRRTRGGWQWLAVVIIAFQFALPFFILLFRAAKRRAETLRNVAALIVVMQLVVTFWLVAPAHEGARFRIHWLDVAAPVGIGGIWVAAFLWFLGRTPLVPLNAPRAHAHEEVHAGAA